MPGVSIDYSNPINVLAFNVTAGSAPGMPGVHLRAGFDNTVPVLAWTVDGVDQFVDSSDPDIALVHAPAAIRVIPAPSCLGPLALGALIPERRRRK